MKIVIKEYQNENYENLLGAFLIFNSVKESFEFGSISWDEMTKNSFLLFIGKWKQVADKEGIDFNMEVSLNDVMDEINDMDAQLISIVESYGDELDAYPVDESQMTSNAGDAVLYMYDDKKYEIITWNDYADEKEPGSKEISELEIEEENE